MSIRLMTLAWELKIPATPKIVLLALCDWANDEGICFPSVARVASRASLSPRQCKRVLHQLADDRWVDVVGNQTGGASSRRYQINVHALRTGDIGVTRVKTSPVARASPAGMTSATTTGDADVTRTTKEPSFEPPLPPAPTSEGLIVPHQLSERERVVVVDLLDGLDVKTRQSLLDELAGQMTAGKIRTTPSNFMRVLVERAYAGRFTPAYGPGIAARRDHEEAERRTRIATRQAKSTSPSPEFTQAKLAEINALLGRQGGASC
ncbi:helix-turn-helix domain-containing protein [Lysobacter firmicutimachus]|uniref:Helix-turn-helix domain-containing protein n=1 Tax=Lysobacter firmicutimachus TaxID=1792846 RepID=A0AAU8N047_9GAMM